MKKLIALICFSSSLSISMNASALTLNASDPNAKSGDVVKVITDADLTQYCNFSQQVVKSLVTFAFYCVKK